MGLDFELIDGQTPLEEEEKEGLLISYISTKQELDEFEQMNIERAIKWTLSKNFKTEEILTEGFIRLVHKKMFEEVWAWAGQFRKTEKNIGVNKFRIPTEVRTLMDDCRYWISNNTFLPDEIAIRFKHRLVAIHCFANGNGRHSRLMGDIISEHIFKNPVFTWGSNVNLAKDGDERARYLAAIKSADGGNISDLIKFARQ
jgi:Fic-DOC domain mobile mystery protein B